MLSLLSLVFPSFLFFLLQNQTEMECWFAQITLTLCHFWFFIVSSPIELRILIRSCPSRDCESLILGWLFCGEDSIGFLDPSVSSEADELGGVFLVRNWDVGRFEFLILVWIVEGIGERCGGGRPSYGARFVGGFLIGSGFFLVCSLLQGCVCLYFITTSMRIGWNSWLW